MGANFFAGTRVLNCGNLYLLTTATAIVKGKIMFDPIHQQKMLKKALVFHSNKSRHAEAIRVKI